MELLDINNSMCCGRRYERVNELEETGKDVKRLFKYLSSKLGTEKP